MSIDIDIFLFFHFAVFFYLSFILFRLIYLYCPCLYLTIPLIFTVIFVLHKLLFFLVSIISTILRSYCIYKIQNKSDPKVASCNFTYFPDFFILIFFGRYPEELILEKELNTIFKEILIQKKNGKIKNNSRYGLETGMQLYFFAIFEIICLR